MSEGRHGSRSPSKLGHVVLRTTRFVEMVRWYKTFLDATATFENEMIAFLTYDDEHHRIAIVHIPGLVERGRGQVGVDHFAFSYPSLRALVAAYDRLHAAGIDNFWATNHGPTTSLYYRDPDGNQIELQVDNFDTRQELIAFFHSPAFAENPIGVDFTIEELRRRLDSGEPEAEIKRRPNRGKRTIADDVPLE